MKWLRARIRAFRSFVDEQVFEFPEGPGLFFLTGRNEEQPRLGANGAGKTTLWEALHWLWFGKTVTGLSAGQVAPWAGDKGTRVELDYEHDGLTYTLGRTWSPNRWYLVHEHGADELLLQDGSNLALDHLGMGQLPFLHCILMAQGEGMFLDLKPEAATSLFSQVMNLDQWLDHSAKASKMAADQDRLLRASESALSRLRGFLDGLQADQFGFTAKEWDEQQAAKIQTLFLDHDRHLAARKVTKAGLKAADERVEFLSREVAKIKAGRARSDDRGTGKGVARVDDLLRSEAVLLSRAKKLRQDCDLVEKNPTCDACGHTLTKREQEGRLAKLLDEEDAVKDELHEVQAKLQQARLDQQARDAANTIEHEALRDLERNLGFAKLDVESLERDLAQTDKILDRLEDDIEKLVVEENPVSAAQAKLEKRRKELLRDIKCEEARQEEIESKMRLYSYWVKGFKEIRLSQVSEALTQLEVEVNSCVNQLGLVGWKLLFKADSETKSGNVKRGFAVEVLSPANDKPVPWKSWSGGEAQRLRIAGNMGLANLIRDRLGITLPIEVWDEPTQFLSQQGVTDLLDGLAQRAEIEQRQIWVVDHRSLGYGGFSGSVTVVKDRKGSRFEF